MRGSSSSLAEERAASADELSGLGRRILEAAAMAVAVHVLDGRAPEAGAAEKNGDGKDTVIQVRGVRGGSQGRFGRQSGRGV